MRKPWLLLPLLLSATLPVLADGGPEQAAVAGATPAHVLLRQQVRAHGVEVTQLQREVSAQESHSHQASERLVEQDREIARLQRQLQALRDGRQGGHPGR